jgi:hypothetical protein
MMKKLHVIRQEAFSYMVNHRWSSGRSLYRDQQVTRIILLIGSLDIPLAIAQGYSTTDLL